MAAYKVEQAYFLTPNYVKEHGGAIADHTVVEDDLAVNERGRPIVAYNPVEHGTIVYSDAESFDLLDDEQKANARYVPDEELLAEQSDRFGALSRLETAKKASSASGSKSKSASKSEDKS